MTQPVIRSLGRVSTCIVVGLFLELTLLGAREAGAARFAYVANNLGSTVSVLRVDANTGALGAVASLIPTPSNPVSVTIDPTVRFVYVAHATTQPGLVSSWVMNPITGELTRTGVVQAGVAPVAVVVEPTGRFAYVANSRSTFLSTFLIDRLTGRLRFIDNVQSDFQRALTLDPSGRFLYALGVGDGVAGFTIDQSTGLLTPFAGGTPTVAGARAIVIDPTGRFMYVAGNRIVRFALDPATGALTDGTVTGGGGHKLLAVHQTGRFLYAGTLADTIRTFEIDPGDGGLTVIATGPGLPQLNSIAVDPTGRSLHATSGDIDGVATFGINLATGTLTPGPPVPSAGDRPVALAVAHPSERFAFSGHSFSSELASFRIDALTGSLTSAGIVAGRPEVAVDPTGRFVYAARLEGFGAPAEIRTYRIDGTTGALTLVGTTVAAPGGNLLRALAVDPSGRFLFATCRCTAPAQDVFAFRLDPITGLPAALGAVNAFTLVDPNAIRKMAVDPAGRFLYVTQGIVMAVLAIDTDTGVLTSAAEFVALLAPIQAMAVDPLGRFAYLAAGTFAGGEGVTRYRIDSATGLLSDPQVCTEPCSGPEHTVLLIGPTGRFLYSLSHGGILGGANRVKVVEIDPTTGVLTAVQQYSLGEPFELDTHFAAVIEATGRFLYVSVLKQQQPEDREIRRLDLDPITGAVVSETVVASFATTASTLVTTGRMR